MIFSIFIAWRTNKESPFFTFLPFLVSVSIIVPCISAKIKPGFFMLPVKSIPIFFGLCGAREALIVSSNEILTLLGLSDIVSSTSVSSIAKFSSKNLTCIFPSTNSLVFKTSFRTLIVVGIPLIIYSSKQRIPLDRASSLETPQTINFEIKLS